MAVSKQQLEQILGKARDLCNPDGDRLVESYKGNGMGSYDVNDPDPSNYGDYEQFDRLYLNEDEDVQPQQKRKPQAKDIRYNQVTAANSRMPEKIKQSMLNEVIDANPLSDINLPQRKPQKRQQMIEEQQYQQPMQVGGVDYSIIKAIVNECLNEYFSKQPLNESNTLTTIGLKAGTIKLVDNKGNVYSADLKKLGNTNNN